MRTVLVPIEPSLLSAELLVVPVVAQRAKQRPDSKRPLPDPWSMFSRDCAAELRKLDREFNGQLGRKLKCSDFHAEPRQRIDLIVTRRESPVTVRLSAIDPDALVPERMGLDDWRRVGADACLAAQRLRVRAVYLWLGWLPARILPDLVEAMSEGAALAAYRFRRYRKEKTPEQAEPRGLFICTPRRLSAPQRVLSAKYSAEATAFARTLVNTAPSDLVPSDLVAAARAIARSGRRVKLRVYDRRALKRMGAGALLAVSRGSTSEPYLIHLRYQPRSARGRRIVLIGKGVTFDSGGLSLKPGKSMEDMKCDMAGAAAVLAVMRTLALANHRLPHEIHAIVPASENMPSGSAVKPGDVVSAINKKTIEILNTDAEGRLLLADALCYAAKLKPDYIIDLATLTGACVVALGSDYAGLFANHEKLARELQKHGEAAGEHLWPLPLAKEYRPLLDSSVANLCNISHSGGPGAILGALFLQEFVPESAAWAHLDIAGPAFVAKSSDYITQGGTGFGVRTLLRFIEKLR